MVFHHFIPGTDYTSHYDYDRFSNPIKETYPSGFTIIRNYDDKGFLTQINNLTTNTYLWKAEEMNKYSQYTKFTQGNNLLNDVIIDDYGLVSDIKAGDKHNLYNDWDTQKGNLLSRTDNIKNLTESFSYTDGLNRLNGSTVTGQDVYTYSYEGNGNIYSKKTNAVTDLYKYSPSHPNALCSVDNTDQLISTTPQVIDYNNEGKTSKITEGDYELNYVYGFDKQRRKCDLKQSGTPIRVTIYAGNYEKITIGSQVYEVHYIAGGSGLSAIMVRHGGEEDRMYYVHTDHLGSILKLTDEGGNVVYEQNFDAWGKERSPQDWKYSGTMEEKPVWLFRGFTGHEHLPEFALINMNGRMYDPAVARFLSPDNYVQVPDFTQSYNRYSYALNNPLVYTDPDGEMTWIGATISILGSAVGIGVGILTGGAIGWVGYYDDETGDWQVYAGGYGTVLSSPTAGYVNFGVTDDKFGFYGGFATTPQWNSGKKKQQVPEIEDTPSKQPKINQSYDGDLLASNDPAMIGNPGKPRPDMDGYITLKEANEWYRGGGGMPLYADLGKINLSRISVSDFPSGLGLPTGDFDLLSLKYFRSPNDALVYGSIKLTLHKDNYVISTLGYDTYNFDIKPWSKSTLPRNIKTLMGRWYNGQGNSFNIYFYGVGRIGR